MNPNLLIVDDEKPTRDGLRAALEDRYEVYVAEDAASAASLLEAEAFEVLLTDFRLPNNEDDKAEQEVFLGPRTWTDKHMCREAWQHIGEIPQQH